VASSPLEIAVRALAHRDRSEADLLRILRRKGVSEVDAAEAVTTLRGAGAIDDDRFAYAAAEALARRGYGDEAIVFRLRRDGLDRELALDAVARLEPECDRATGVAAQRGASERTARWLTSRGFARDSIEAALAAIAETGASELG
jgi:SOS response regulatory protein OraA/RecX